MPTRDEGLTADRTYVEIRPTTTAITPAHVTTAVRALHGTADDPPTIEMLLLTSGDEDGVSYYFGADSIETDRLRAKLRRALPTGYELTTTTTSLATALTTDPTDAPVADPTEHDAEQAIPLADRSVAGLEIQAAEQRAGDWQTRLRTVAELTEDDRTNWPLTTVVDALADAEVPTVYQALLEPKADWQTEAHATIDEYHYPQRGLGDVILEALVPGMESEFERLSSDEVAAEYRSRIESIEAADARASFRVNTRVVAFGADSASTEAPLADIDGAFAEVGQNHYQLTTTRYAHGSDGAASLADDLATRTMRSVALSRRLERRLNVSIPLSTNIHPRIVADPTTVGQFCLVGGANLPERATQAMETRTGERTAIPLPPDSTLDTYRTDGYTLGIPQTSDRADASEPIAVPPDLQHRHQFIAGGTGSGKSVLGTNGLLANHAATEGATVIIESKDGQMADDYERAHYAEYGSLESVYRFDAARQVPATPFFDVTRQQASGIARSQAVEDVADHFEELLRAIMGTEQFDQAFTSSTVIEAIVKAMFDPVHGNDQFTLDELQQRISRFAETGHAPPVVDEGLRRELQRIADNSEDTFQEIVAGAARRIGTAAMDSRIAPLFNYAPQADGERPAVPIDWRAKLDEDCVIIIDTSKLHEEPQRVVTLVVLSQLWTALQRRDREHRQGHAVGDPPLVSVHIEEAATVAASGILADLLREGRSFGVGVTLSLQYPRQLKRVDEATYEEAINNIGTVVTGRVTDDPALAKRLATDDMPPEAVATRLGRLGAGEWLVSLPSPFGNEPPRPLLLESLPLPPGHPEGDDPLSAAQQATFEAAQTQRSERTRRHGVSVTPAAPVASGGADSDDTDDEGTEPTRGTEHGPIETTLPFTRRLPAGVSYHEPSASLVCDACETRYGRRLSELLAAVDCHGDRSDIDRLNVPPLHVGLTLSPGERSTLEYSDSQLVFLQLVYNAHQQRYDRDWEYDIVRDGMEPLRAYAGLSDDEFERVVLDGLLTVDGDYPHTLYTVTADGREVIGAAHREGRAHGDGVGDLSESSLHVMMVESMARAFESRFVDDSDHAAVTVETYYPVDDGRLDVAVLDGDGDVLVTGEAERSNHDTLRAVPADYDKMAACDPDRAFWIVEGRSEGHEIIRALHNPGSGDPRVDRTYSESYALTRIAFDEPGFTDIYTIGSFHNQFLDTAGE
ncbi:ATP-binding protein [Halosimplex pelagicum]|uniref:ATP-binding protein n=1 Tax=Halosimplex pelagicum TaxID=869886 RepID=A0A7D5TRJ5_9EURY|nr:ATP-binding protein [Halosimplex pelagicum]QLH81332.1 ATP-binding protein [Halosimplex pelagicum]